MPRKTRSPRSPAHAPSRFNEAAARCRGKHRLVDRVAAGGAASMRPRPDAAENPAPGDHDLRLVARLQ